MANTFGSDILLQAPDPTAAAQFYVETLGFEITQNDGNLIGLRGSKINLYIERGPALGPVLEVFVKEVAETKQRLLGRGCEVLKDEPEVPRTYIRDPFGLIYNIAL
jgi:catechol 2,3-dioxygenase-like lactoylglutathione lyase family enzyme